MLTGTSGFHHITSILSELHWLPIELSCPIHNGFYDLALYDLGPGGYLKECLLHCGLPAHVLLTLIQRLSSSSYSIAGRCRLMGTRWKDSPGFLPNCRTLFPGQSTWGSIFRCFQTCLSGLLLHPE